MIADLEAVMLLLFGGLWSGFCIGLLFYFRNRHKSAIHNYRGVKT